MKKLLINFFVLTIIQFSYAQRTKGETKQPQKARTATATGVGVNVNLSGILHAFKKKCNQVKIVFPKKSSKYKSNNKSPLVFKWKSSKPKLVKSYKVGLAILNGNEKKMLYQANTYKTETDWPKKVAWTRSKKGKATYQFFVMALMKEGSKCKNVVVSNVFTVVTDKPFVADNQQNVKVEVRGWNPSKEKPQNKKPSRTGRNPQTGATIQIAAKKVAKFKAGTASNNTVDRVYGSGKPTKTAILKKLADELVNLAVKENPHPHGNNEKYADLKKLADELVNLATKENPNHHRDDLKYVDLKKLADELVNLAVKENPNHHGDNLKYADLKKLADELVNLAVKDKDSAGNIHWNVKEILGIKKPLRTGRNPQTGATIRKSITVTAINRKNQKRKLLNLLPKNNSSFKRINDIGTFTWKLVGNKIANPQYVIEVVKLGKANRPERTYYAKTSNTYIKAKDIFKDKKISNGQYQWKVTETTTGTSSGTSYFTLSSCQINFTITNNTIECLGYGTAGNRQYKICFNSTYSSTSGNLTFANSGAGLSVYDQSYSPLTYTLLSPNPTLVTQIGSSTSTKSYCFKVTVPSSVTSIGFGLQGDDLDPSPIECKPGVNELFDNLPSCFCDDCSRIRLTFDDFNISPNDTIGNQFNFNGNINVNVPIYGLEFQVQSYSYTANPGTCSNGVTSLEESGMILMPGTTINGSTSLQLFNETVSGSSSSNNNATKDIKFVSGTPLTGPIPVNLTVGLPAPLVGLMPGCCKIDYTVCFKVTIFYQDGTCKSCVFTKCFNFNNQK